MRAGPVVRQMNPYTCSAKYYTALYAGIAMDSCPDLQALDQIVAQTATQRKIGKEQAASFLSQTLWKRTIFNP